MNNTSNLVITFGNLKGGTGKTTLCALFATYCVEQGFPVAVMDADTQRSLQKNRSDDAFNNQAKIPWRIWSLRMDEKIKATMNNLHRVPGIVLIDCPGSVDNDNIKYVYNSADIVVIPFRFDRMNVRETETFAQQVKVISKAKRLFLPNIVTQYDDRREELKAAIEQASNTLGKLGLVLPAIADSLDIRVSNTLGMNYKQRRVVREAFDAIIEVINKIYK